MSKILYSLDSLNKLLKKEKPSKICIVTSGVLVKKLNWAIRKIRDGNKLPGRSGADVDVVLLPDGEKAKEWKVLEKLLQEFVKRRLDRNSIVVVLGGGTVGDLVGFAASIYLRGIRYVQMPTTLLAQVDSAHGGKTGINFLGYKNQIGSLHLPIVTVVDERFIKSLSKGQLVDGLGEIIKAGLIRDTSILKLLEKENVGTLAKSANLQKIIKKAIDVKLHFVGKDFKDGDERQILNVGHTIGHGIELKYKISHGRAVLIGIAQELMWTESAGITEGGVRERFIGLLSKLGIDLDLDLKADWKTILHDKKIAGNKIALPVVEREGKSKVLMLDLENFTSVLSYK